MTPEEKLAALRLQLPENFYRYKHAPPCTGCPGCEKDSDSDVVLLKSFINFPLSCFYGDNVNFNIICRVIQSRQIQVLKEVLHRLHLQLSLGVDHPCLVLHHCISPLLLQYLEDLAVPVKYPLTSLQVDCLPSDLNQQQWIHTALHFLYWDLSWLHQPQEKKRACHSSQLTIASLLPA